MDPIDAYAQVAQLLYGAGADELIAKFSAPQAPQVPKLPDDIRPTKRRMTHGLEMGANSIAIAGGVHALAMSSGDKNMPGSKVVRRTAGRLAKLPGGKQIARANEVVADKITKNPKAAAGLAAGWVGLHGLELYGDVRGRHAMQAEYSRQDSVKKDAPDQADLHAPGTEKRVRLNRGTLTGLLVDRSIKTTKKAVPVVHEQSKRIKANVEEKIDKSGDFDLTWEGEISKFDSDKRQVFGWASIVEVNGEPVVDLQGDYITPDEIEKAAYDYVQKSRKGGDMHKRNGDEPLHVSDLIESFMVTDEKKKIMGLPDSTPTGWWCGFQVNDDATWDLVKKGHRKGFSIHGRGKRIPMEDR